MSPIAASDLSDDGATVVATNPGALVSQGLQITINSSIGEADAVRGGAETAEGGDELMPWTDGRAWRRRLSEVIGIALL